MPFTMARSCLTAPHQFVRLAALAAAIATLATGLDEEALSGMYGDQAQSAVVAPGGKRLARRSLPTPPFEREVVLPKRRLLAGALREDPNGRIGTARPHYTV